MVIRDSFYEGYNTGPDVRTEKPGLFFTVGSGDAGQGPVDNILLVFMEEREVGCRTGP